MAQAKANRACCLGGAAVVLSRSLLRVPGIASCLAVWRDRQRTAEIDTYSHAAASHRHQVAEHQADLDASRVGWGFQVRVCSFIAGCLLADNRAGTAYLQWYKNFQEHREEHILDQVMAATCSMGARLLRCSKP